MDKETLLHYGWVVICILVISVIIALATPFGNFVGVGVQGVMQGYIDTNEQAITDENMENIRDKFKDELDLDLIEPDYGSSGNYPVATGSALDKSLLTSNLKNITGKITFSNDKAPSSATTKLNSAGDVVCEISGNNATIYNVNGGGVAAPSDCSYLFAGENGGSSLMHAKEYDFKGLDTGNVTNMSYMFYKSKASVLNLSGFNTKSVTNMSEMFGYSNATTIYFGNFNTNNVTTMNGMFRGAIVNNLDLSSFDTVNVKNMENMFRDSKSTYINFRRFNVSSATNMVNMFMGCKTKVIDLSSWTTTNHAAIDGLFKDSATTQIDLSGLDTDTVSSMSGMFSGSKAYSVICRSNKDIEKMKTSGLCTASGFKVK